MAKEIAISKYAKISQAQQYVLLAVLGAAIVLGVAISLVMHFVRQISFNANVIAEEEKAIVSYSDAIKGIGICKKPSGEVYSDEELKKCNPDSVEASSVPNTLRSDILEKIAANAALNSVPKDSIAACINPETNKNYTYAELNDFYNNATTSEQLVEASDRIQVCSALRVIPDSLPASKNEEALLSSLNKIFILSNDSRPEQLSPSGSSGTASFGKNLDTIAVRLAMNSDVATTIKFLDNVERSIREFNISSATIKWEGANTLNIQGQATAYYMTPSTIVESSKVIKSGDEQK